MTTWTPDSVLALAPDAGSAKAAQGLAAARQWSLLGRDEIALWGEILGSGTKPYQARIDLREPAFKCSCPSRKFPCKHGLALLLILAREPGAFTKQAAPDWVQDWLKGRDQREEKRADKATAEPADPKARERRAEKREERIDAGLEQLQVWLGDLVRAGLAKAKSQPPAFWETMAARLVDAQAPGVARLVRQLETLTQTGIGWESRLLHAVARIELIRVSYARRAALPLALAEEAATAVGRVRTQDELAAEPAVADCWQVLGIAQEFEDRFKVRRTWLWGLRSQRPALLLDYAVGTQGMDAGLPVGLQFDGELAFYPGSARLRAAVRSRDGLPRAGENSLPLAPSIADALDEYAEALARTPWLDRYPLRLGKVRISLHLPGEGAVHVFLVDSTDHRLPLPPKYPAAWHLLAVSGGEAFDVVGEWDGEFFSPLAVVNGAATYALAEGSPALRAMEAA